MPWNMAPPPKKNINQACMVILLSLEFYIIKLLSENHDKATAFMTWECLVLQELFYGNSKILLVSET